MTSQFFITDLDENGHPKLIHCNCGQIFTKRGYGSHKRGCKRGIRN